MGIVKAVKTDTFSYSICRSWTPQKRPTLSPTQAVGLDPLFVGLHWAKAEHFRHFGFAGKSRTTVLYTTAFFCRS